MAKGNSKKNYWYFPKRVEFWALADVIDTVNRCLLTKPDRYPYLEEVEAEVKKRMSSRSSKTEKTDNPKYRIEACVLYGFLNSKIVTANEQKESLWPTDIGELFAALWKKEVRVARGVVEQELLSYIFYRSFIRMKSKGTDSRPYLALLRELVGNEGLTVEEICEKFYGQDDEADFLGKNRPAQMQFHPNIYWEYAYANLSQAKLIEGDATVLGFRYYKEDSYKPSQTIRPTPLLVNFWQNGPLWEARLQSSLMEVTQNQKGALPEELLLLQSNSGSEGSESSEEAELERKLVYATVRERQAKFREECLADWGSCAICQIRDVPLLEAAHLLPVSFCTQKHQAADRNNGILLCALHHTAFDRGLIEFGVPTGNGVLEAKDNIFILTSRSKDTEFVKSLKGVGKIDFRSKKRSEYMLQFLQLNHGVKLKG